MHSSPISCVPQQQFCVELLLFMLRVQSFHHSYKKEFGAITKMAVAILGRLSDLYTSTDDAFTFK